MRAIRRSWVLAAATLVVAAVAGNAGAVGEPFSFATTRDGSLLLASGAIVSPKTVELMGGWLDNALACTESRELTVEVLVDRVRNGATTRRTFEKTGLVENCAEGGPNFGFLLRARTLGMGCPLGGWRSGIYTFTTTTTDATTGIVTGTSLQWQKTNRCG